MARRKLHQTPDHMAGLLLWISCSLCFFRAAASPPEVRVLEVKIAAAMEFKMSKMWKVEMHKMVRDISCGFKSRFGIAFKVREIDFWEREPGPKSLPDHLRDLVEKVPRGKCQLVVGIIPSAFSQGPPYGIADYLHAYVLLRDHPSKSGLAGVLEHELCHIFGAVDLNENGSIMSLEYRGGRYDAFTMSVMTLNRDRSFRADEFPLPPDLMEEVTALYKERLGQDEERADSSTGEEQELQIVLSHLRREESRHSGLNH
jgi:hypothetical protein